LTPQFHDAFIPSEVDRFGHQARITPAERQVFLALAEFAQEANDFLCLLSGVTRCFFGFSQIEFTIEDAL
jgi:hypothetical protein